MNKIQIHLTGVILLILMSACDKQPTDTPDPSAANATTANMPLSANTLEADELGLSKTSVFATPEPPAVSYSDKFPGQSTVLPRSFPHAPPQIPHTIDSFKPITAGSNACLGCHNNPAMRGKKIEKGTPTPMPVSHYTDLRHKPDSVSEQMIAARYVCTQCHVPQANVDTLVENTFQSPELKTD